MSHHIAGTARPALPPRASAKRWQWLLFATLLVAASTRLLLASQWKGELLGPRSPLLYQAATLGFNYFEMGPIRRGLAGTVVHLIGSDILLATVVFHLASAFGVAVTTGLIFVRMKAPLVTRGVFAFVLVAIMLRWAEDAGRTDMAVASMLAGSTLAMTRGRLVLASVLVCIGLFIHETSFIFGLPLLATLAWRQRFTLSSRAWWQAAAVFSLTLLLYASTVWLPHATPQAMAAMVRAKFAPDKIVDWAIYFAVSGARGVQASMCQNRTDPNYWLHWTGGLVSMAVMTFALARASRRDWAGAALAALPPFAFLCIVANDTSRWTMLASYNAWLVLATTRLDGRSPRPAAIGVSAAAVAFLLLTYPKPDKVDYPIYAGSPLIEKIARKLDGPRTPNVEEALQRCDPEWRTVLEASGPLPVTSGARPVVP